MLKNRFNLEVTLYIGNDTTHQVLIAFVFTLIFFNFAYNVHVTSNQLLRLEEIL